MKQVKVRDLLQLIPDEILDKIGTEVEVDKVNQQLTGKTIFNALLFSLAQTTRMSLRMLEKVYNSALFQQFSGNSSKTKTRGRHSSFADRLSKIKVDYFAKIFNHLVEGYHAKMPPTILNKLYRFDATIVGISAKIFEGLNCGGSNAKSRRHLKIVVGQKGLIPSSLYVCTQVSETSDNTAIPKAIAEAILEPDDIITFDRGVQAAAAYERFVKAQTMFVARIKVNRKYKAIETSYQQDASQIGDIISDEKIFLWNSDKECFFTTEFRLIKVLGNEKKEVWILTNVFTLTAMEIAEIYKRRWDIEVLFRFVKQELNLKHFLARNLNGIKVYIYMIFIMAILLLMYKTANSLTSFKMAKIDFFTELENETICDLIKIAGGNPQIFLEKFGLL